MQYTWGPLFINVKHRGHHQSGNVREKINYYAATFLVLLGIRLVSVFFMYLKLIVEGIDVQLNYGQLVTLDKTQLRYTIQPYGNQTLRKAASHG